MSAVGGDECEKTANDAVRRTRSGRTVKSVTPKKPPPSAKKASAKPSKTIKRIKESGAENEEIESEQVTVQIDEVQASVEECKEYIDELACDPNAPENEVLDFEPGTNEDALEDEVEALDDEQVNQDHSNEITDADQNQVNEYDDVNENETNQYENEENNEQQEADYQMNEDQYEDQRNEDDQNVEDQNMEQENVDECMNVDDNIDEQTNENYEANDADNAENDQTNMDNQMNCIENVDSEMAVDEAYANGVSNNSAQEMEDAEIAEDTLVLHDDEPLQDTFEPKIEPDTEAVSEDELPTEAAAKEPETEAVSDEELPAATTADLGETESVSEDELPPDSDRKKKGKSSSKTPEKKRKPDSGSTSKIKRKLNAEGEYDPGSPTSETNEETPAKKVALTSDAESTDKEVKPSSPKKKSLPELEKYWKAVNEDPTDFTGWTYLLQYVDQENDAEAAREAYNKFLERYPYCYGYWRKFADYEKKKGDPDRVQTVFDQGLNAISLSVDLWLHYITYCKSIYEKDEDKMREQYERAIQSCGLEFRSDRLWESYIKWELEAKRLNKVTGLYDRLLTTPTLGYISHFESFQEFVSSNSPNRILSVDDFLSIRAEVKALLKSDDSAASAVSDEAPPGEEPVDDIPPTDEETRMIREKIISSRRKLHKANVNAVAARWSFEEGIKRPYFHVKPLERCQLKNWKEYLDFEIEQKDQERIIILFERCLIACALYEEFWMRFVRYLESQKSDNTERIRNVYMRACTTHHPKKPNLHLQWAAFEENQENLEKASSILENIDTVIPNMLQVAYRRINLERRKGDLDQACALYESYITNSKNRTIANNIVVKYARFLCKVKNDIDKAVKVLLKATEKDKDNPRLYLQLIDLGLQRSPIDPKEVIGYMDMFIDREHADLEQRLLFAQRKVEFLEDFSPDIRQVLKAHDQFQKCIKQAKDSRKKAKSEESKFRDMSPPRKSKSSSSSDHSNFPPPPVGSQSYQYSSSSSSAYQQQPQYQSSQYGSQSGYGPQSYQQYPAQSDPNYANYQNWQYNQSGTQAYGQYNQWGSYNYY